ncbi:MAG: BlaI/MecI/CopY family transcriptional regulator [Bryobacteraceae bacterium]
MRASEIPPPLELDCLRVLWRLGAGSVGEIRAELLKSRPLAYTTVMTLMERLATRGAVDREKKGRAFLYRPKLERDQARRAAVRELVESFFGGSEAELRAYLDRGAVSPRADGPEVTGGGLDPTLL